MTPSGRRRRALLLLSLALACGGLAASAVRDRVEEVEARVGTPLPVVVAAHDLPPGRALGQRDLALRRVPARFLPPDALVAAADAAGLRTAVHLPAGAYVTAAQLEGRSGRGRRLRRGERAVEVAVAGAGGLGEAPPGTRVDVVVSSEPRSGGARTRLALEDVELLGLRPGAPAEEGRGASEGAVAAATASATLRVTLRQALYLTAAQNFARELRLLARPAGDRRRLGRSGFSGAGL